MGWGCYGVISSASLAVETGMHARLPRAKDQDLELTLVQPLKPSFPENEIKEMTGKKIVCFSFKFLSLQLLRWLDSVHRFACRFPQVINS